MLFLSLVVVPPQTKALTSTKDRTRLFKCRSYSNYISKRPRHFFSGSTLNRGLFKLSVLLFKQLSVLLLHLNPHFSFHCLSLLYQIYATRTLTMTHSETHDCSKENCSCRWILTTLSSLMTQSKTSRESRESQCISEKNYLRHLGERELARLLLKMGFFKIGIYGTKWESKISS